MQENHSNSFNGLMTFLSTTPKNRLIIDLNGSMEKEGIDIGLQLASALIECENPSMIVGNVIYKLIQEHKALDNKIGYYIALKNIGILFEPTLKINMRMLIDSVSQSMTLILNTSGKVRNNTFYFIDEESGITVSLAGMSYYTIE